MRVVIQRSLDSDVQVDEQVVGAITKGLVLLVCMEQGDDGSTIKKAAEKILKLRIFPDEQGRMNQSITDVKGEILAISQFTLSWRGQKGNRPSFDRSMEPEKADQMFNEFCGFLSQEVRVETGQFGAHMLVSIKNHGPVTFVLDF